MSSRAFVMAPVFLALLFLASACGGSEKNAFEVDSLVVTEADRPIAMAFAPDGRLFYAEQLTGDIRVIDAEGQVQSQPFAHVDIFLGGGTLVEWGLMGLAVDVDFESNHYVYAYFTQSADPGPPAEVKPVVIRFTENDNTGQQPKILMDDLPPSSSFFNVAGSIHSGPDGFLYVSVGDYDNPEFAIDLTVAQGKMLRLDKETGAAAPANPFANQFGADPRIFAYGFREDFDFAFHPQSGELYGSDQTPVSCSELNIIKGGASYGWPSGEFPWPDCLAGQQNPAIHFFAKEGLEPGVFLSFVTSTGLEFVSGKVYPLLGDSLLVCERETKQMRRVVLSGAALDQVTDDDVVVKDCWMDIAVSPGGIVYYSNDTEIRRLVQISK
ncbi:MAG: PQQ-dependent sugar dehydrogenase [Dehalococcoidia bacterium]|nr:PQQ-dependent sugar dehydrogenase [Dehalococcoidia bacterium]